MRIIRAATCRPMPWKNGGGDTTEIAVGPAGAGLDDFVWRLSAARVAQDGPFSLFPGVDRTLAVLSGEGLELEVGDDVARLGPSDAPFSFPGDQPTQGRLIGGPVEDLNIMTRRRAVRHRMRRVAVEGVTDVRVEGATVLVFCAGGEVTIGDEVLAVRDTLLFASAASSLAVKGEGHLYLIEVSPVSDVKP